jgi:hypothetical protein
MVLPQEIPPIIPVFFILLFVSLIVFAWVWVCTHPTGTAVMRSGYERVPSQSTNSASIPRNIQWEERPVGYERVPSQSTNSTSIPRNIEWEERPVLGFMTHGARSSDTGGRESIKISSSGAARVPYQHSVPSAKNGCIFFERQELKTEV